MTTTASIFARIYKLNSWGLGSGHGSLPNVTEGYRKFVQSFMLENEVITVVDFGCGDWQFSRFMDWSKVDYLGLDVVDEVVQKNQRKHGSKNVRFQLTPARFSDVPTGDLLLVKDVLQHLPTNIIHSFMAEVVPRFRFALITNCIEPASQRNREIQLGGWRPLDLRADPFRYAAPVVFSFSGPQKIVLRQFKVFPSWRKAVLLYSRSQANRFLAMPFRP